MTTASPLDIVWGFIGPWWTQIFKKFTKATGLTNLRPKGFADIFQRITIAIRRENVAIYTSFNFYFVIRECGRRYTRLRIIDMNLAK